MHGRVVTSMTWQHIIAFSVSKLVSSSLSPNPWLVAEQGSCSVQLLDKISAQYITLIYFCSAYLQCPITGRTFKVCKSVHHHTIQINHQPDTTIFQFIILTFIYRSTCFGRSPAHRQELSDCSSSLWFYLHILVIVVLCSWSGRPNHEHSTAITTIWR